MTATIAKEKPIIFTGHSVPAILRGQKTQTRRVAKLPDDDCTDVVRIFDPSAGREFWRFSLSDGVATQCHDIDCPYGVPGDRLWCRESFITGWPADSGYLRTFDGDGNEIPEQVWYRASETDFTWLDSDGYMTDRVPWKSPLFMPRRLSRLTLEITEVRVERLQAITHEDAVAEGFGDHLHKKTPDAPYGRTWGRLGFSQQWDKLNAKRGFTWESDPFVWVIAFRRLEAS